MSFLLDTDIYSAYIRDKRVLFTRFNQHMVTHNTQDFVAIPGIQLVDWLQP